MEFEDELKLKTLEVEKIVFSYLPKEEGFARTVISAMDYSMLAGGKRLRPLFMYEIYRMFGGTSQVVEPFMAAQEMIHTYSLVHDDLEAMDNDEFRRGRKTTHVIYGEGMAVLAGDGLLNMAFETAIQAFDIDSGCRDSIIKALRILADKAGLKGMLGGQAVDVDVEEKNRQIGMDELMFIHENKTGALIQSSMMIGAVLAGADDEVLAKVERMALYIGTAFQIEDDILDVVGDEKVLGKPVGSDRKNNKTTYVTLMGMDKAREDARRMSDTAIELYHELPSHSPFIEELIRSLVYRNK